MARGFGGVIYGKEGMGKTSLALQFPGPIYCLSIGENGYECLEDVGKVPADSVNININNLDELVKNINPITKGTIVIDGCKGLQSKIFDYVQVKYYENDPKKFNSYSQGARKESPVILQGVLDLCTKKMAAGINVIFLAHMGTTSLPNSSGADYLSHVILMDDGDKGGMRSTLTSWAGFIFFLNMGVDIGIKLEQDKHGQATEGKVTGLSQRWVYTTTALYHQAKNRWDMPLQIPMGKNPTEAFTNLWKHFPEVYKKK